MDSHQPTDRPARFPEHAVESISGYMDGYERGLRSAMASVDRGRMQAAADVLAAAMAGDACIFVCGNGGSAAISNHLVCDHAKGCQTDTGLRPRVFSLSSTIEMITAIANDISYDDVFAYQLATVGRPGDVLITISSSGNSENVVRAADRARAQGLKTIALTGFQGGRTAEMADVNLHVDAHNYGMVEDVHQSLMHILAQYLRQSHMPADLVGSRTF